MLIWLKQICFNNTNMYEKVGLFKLLGVGVYARNNLYVVALYWLWFANKRTGVLAHLRNIIIWLHIFNNTLLRGRYYYKNFGQ